MPMWVLLTIKPSEFPIPPEIVTFESNPFAYYLQLMFPRHLYSLPWQLQ